MPGWFGRIGAGAAGGVVGGVVFGILMQVTGAIPVVASLVDQESAAAGWAVHMGIAVCVGVSYALVFGAFTEGLPISIVLGTFYGIAWWVLGGLTLLPLRLGFGLFVFDTAAWQSLAGHVAYGLALGLVYPVVSYLLVRAPDRTPLDPADTDPLPSLGTATLPPAAPPPAFLEPPPASPPRSGLTPLSPQARALRQRGRLPRGL